MHTIRQGALVLKKGTLIGPAEVAALEAAGIKDIVVARLEPGDVSEDEAAAEIAKAVAGQGVARRSRLHRPRQSVRGKRRRAGGRPGSHRPAQPHRRGDHVCDAAGVQAGGRRRDDRDGEDHPVRDQRGCAEGGAALRGGKPFIRVAPYKIKKVGVVSTLLPGLAAKVVEKTLRVTEERLAPAGATIVAERRVPHEQAALAKAIDEVLKAGRRAGRGVRRVGHRRPARRDPGGGRGRSAGAIEHFGMPVDPGNLMLIGSARGQPILGAPGCARSPKENGFDWVLMRLLAGLAGVARRTSPGWASAGC